jgi:hypothetical protein
MQFEPSLKAGAQIVAVRRFARDLGVHEESAVAVFEAQVRSLQSQARVTRYIAVLAEKRAKDALRHAARSAPSTRSVKPSAR